MVTATNFGISVGDMVRVVRDPREGREFYNFDFPPFFYTSDVIGSLCRVYSLERYYVILGGRGMHAGFPPWCIEIVEQSTEDANDV